LRIVSFAVSLLLAGLAHAGPIGIAGLAGYFFSDATLIAQVDSGSLTYFSTLDPNNVGTFGWTFTNTSGSTLTNVSLFGFLDSDLDRDLNTFFNEYGTFIDLSQPPSAPAGSIAPSSWQIDEPGFVFGTIKNDLLLGLLRNANFVPSSAPDDVSLALGFLAGTLVPGQVATLTFQISTSDIGGLQQVDPDSGSNLYLNGYITLTQPQSGVPEPADSVFMGVGVTLMFVVRHRRRRSL
jgi:hypothetical protein